MLTWKEIQHVMTAVRCIPPKIPPQISASDFSLEINHGVAAAIA
jgi:hypothetical protein